jgi:hypothetical protein
VAAAGAAIGAGLPSLPAPSAVTAQSSAAELIDLGARFEPLLDRYYVAHRRWSGALSQANAEHDREFGTPAQRNYEYSPEVARGSKIIAGVSASTKQALRWPRFHDEMEPPANAINAAPVNSIEGLRAKALVVFWEIAPLRAGSSHYSFEDGLPFQWLFTAVAELCGLKNKIMQPATRCRPTILLTMTPTAKRRTRDGAPHGSSPAR